MTSPAEQAERSGGWHLFPLWKRWGLLGVMLCYWSGRLMEYRIWGKPLVIQVLWSGERPAEEIPWITLVFFLEFCFAVFIPVWYTLQAVRYPAVRLERQGIRLAWPIPRRERIIPWASVQQVRPSLGFSWMDVSWGGAWLVLRDGDEIPISYGLSGGVELIDELERRIATRDR